MAFPCAEPWRRATLAEDEHGSRSISRCRRCRMLLRGAVLLCSASPPAMHRAAGGITRRWSSVEQIGSLRGRYSYEGPFAIDCTDRTRSAHDGSKRCSTRAKREVILATIRPWRARPPRISRSARRQKRQASASARRTIVASSNTSTVAPGACDGGKNHSG